MTKNCYPCILLFNDIHVSKDNISEFNTNWDEALEICEQRGIKEIALGGDLFHSRSSQTLSVLLTVHDALLRAASKGIHLTIANGNHDLVDQEAIRGYCHLYALHPNVTVVDDLLTLGNEDWAFALHMIAYFPENGSFREKLGCLVAGGLEKIKSNYLYIHEGINGALAQPSEDELPTHIFSDFDRVLVGHYHDRTIVKGTDIEYIGSSRQHNFGEDEEKGYTILFSDGSIEFVKNRANTRYRIIDVSVEGVSIHLLDRLEEMKADGRVKVKVRVHGSGSAVAAVDKNSIMNAGASKVEIVEQALEVVDMASSSLFERFDSQKIRESYEEFCVQKDIENVSLGLSYLAKIEVPCGN